jgi:molecular chaperone HtpG
MQIEDKLKVIRQGSIGTQSLNDLVTEIDELLDRMRQTAKRESLKKELGPSLNTTIRKLDRSVNRIRDQRKPAKVLTLFPARKRKIYEEVFALIYDCSTNQANAHKLVEQILNRLSAL